MEKELSNHKNKRKRDIREDSINFGAIGVVLMSLPLFSLELGVFLLVTMLASNNNLSLLYYLY